MFLVCSNEIAASAGRTMTVCSTMDVWNHVPSLRRVMDLWNHVPSLRRSMPVSNYPVLHRLLHIIDHVW